MTPTPTEAFVTEESGDKGGWFCERGDFWDNRC
jgi:hypothetical protein